MPRAAYTVAAARDLEETYAFTLEHWGQAQADGYLQLLRSACERAAVGAPTALRLAHRPDNLFRLRCGRHLIVFRPHDDGALIVRVLHERMDIDARLQEG